MRLLVGMILGAAITIGAAYMHDQSEPQAIPGTSRTIVNWDVATQVADNAMRTVRQQVDRLIPR
jgi:hypothetical protein